jgi:dihydroflavonol-4-reductase
MATKYLLTGAAGHLGSALIRELQIENASVRALVLPNDDTAALLPSWVEKTVGDVCDINSLEAFFNNPDKDELIVIHAAGIVSIASKYDQKVYDVNVQGTKNIISMCLKSQVKKLLYISSVHAIPELPRGETISEVTLFSPDKVTGLYAKTKAEATQAVLDSIALGLNISIVHPSGIIGPYDNGRGLLAQMIIDYYKGRLTAYIVGGYDFVDVRDVAKGIINCCDRGRSGECYILSNQYYSVKELLDLLHKISGKKEVKTLMSLEFAKLVAPLAELYYKILKQPPLYTAYSMYTLSSNSTFSHQKASRELGYTLTPIEVSLRDTIAWLKSNGKI